MLGYYLYVYVCKGFNVDYVLCTIAHYKVRLNVEIINVFRADKMPQIHDIMFGFFRFGRKLNRADSKNSVMTLTRIQ
jgi:hypothetical protein